MKKSAYILLIVTLLASCESINNLEVDSTNSDDVTNSMGSADLKSAEIINNETAENALCELSYEAEFYANSQHLLKKFTRINGLHQVLNGTQCDRYNNGVAPDISIDTADTGYPIIITINYGDSTRVSNGRIISGFVIIEISAPDSVDGATQSITFENCVIDTITINGDLSQTLIRNNSSRIVTTVADITITIGDSTAYYITGEYLREWIAGLETPLDHYDDIIQITGSATITNFDGITWERKITSPLIKNVDCRFFVEGTIDIVQEGIVLATLDYGDGICDNLATLTTADGVVTEIVLYMHKADKHKHHQHQTQNKEKENEHENSDGEGNHGGEHDNGGGNGHEGGNGNG